jgi:hypothetical protein
MRNANMETENTQNLNKTDEITQENQGKTTTLELTTGILVEPPIIPTTLPSYQRTQVNQDIMDFLAKPIYLSAYTFATTDARAANIISFNIASTILAGGYDPWIKKLAGFYSIHATFCVDFIINSTPFHSGALLFNYFPNTAVLIQAPNMHAKDLNGQSQLPASVVANINKNHYAFKVPYIASAEMFVLNGVDANFPDWGQINAYVWSPLKTGASGSTSVTVSMWGHWEDVVLGPVYPQAGGKRKTVKNVTRIAPADAEQAPSGGPLSNALETVSVASDMMSDIPILGPIAGAVSWATGIASGIASFFGFSKPVAEVVIARHFSNIDQFGHNGSGSCDALVLATQHDAKTRIVEEKTIYEYDEMSINFIKTRPAYIRAVNYTTTTAVAQLDAFTLRLSDFYTSVSYDTLSLRQYTPIGLLASVFYQYTGGIKIKIKFFKTAFHAGTLCFTFVPEVTSASSYTFNQLQACNRYIIDIQTEDELILEIPYQRPYPNEYCFEQLGTLYCHAVTPLRAPETVANNIDITYEVMGADDLMFYNPQADIPVPIICQGAVEEVGDQTESVIGGSIPVTDVLQVSQDCIGEQVNSIKQLILRNNRVATALDFTAFDTWWFGPHYVSTYKWLAATHTTSYPFICSSIFELFAFCYAYRRGSVRWRFLRENSSAANILWKEMHSTPSNDFGGTSTTAYTQIQRSNTAPINNGVANKTAFFSYQHAGSSIQVPMQHISVVAPNEPFFTGQLNRNQPSMAVAVKSTSTTNDLHIYRSVADDFQFKFWIGVPLTNEGPI